MSAQHSNVIKCENVVKQYPLSQNRLIKVLQGVDLEVRAREYVILFGPSGCGKTTLLHLIAGLEKPDSGKVLIRGEDVSHYSKIELARHHRTKIGMVFQQFNLIPTLSVSENIALPELFAGKPLASRMERAYKLLDIFGLKELEANNVNELSGGEQQRVALARSLANNPWILLIDEPTGNLDSKSAGEVMAMIAHLNEYSRRTILMVTHNLDYLHFAHRVLYMKDGKIVDEKVNRRLTAAVKHKEHDDLPSFHFKKHIEKIEKTEEK